MATGLQYAPLGEKLVHAVYASPAFRREGHQYRHIYALTRYAKPTNGALVACLQESAHQALSETFDAADAPLVQLLRENMPSERIQQLATDETIVRKLVDRYSPTLATTRPTPHYLNLHAAFIRSSTVKPNRTAAEWVERLTADEQCVEPVSFAIQFTDWILPLQHDLETLITHQTRDSETFQSTGAYDPPQTLGVIRGVYDAFSEPGSMRRIPNITSEAVMNYSIQVLAGFFESRNRMSFLPVFALITPGSEPAPSPHDLSDPQIPGTVFVRDSGTEKPN